MISQGWIGEGITTPNKNVTIPTGTTGPRSYIANWTKKTAGIDNNS